MSVAVKNNTRTFILITACLCALAYWVFDAAGQLWLMHGQSFDALFPGGGELAFRIAGALAVATGGALASSIVATYQTRAAEALQRLDDCDRQHRATLLTSLESVVAIDADGCIVNTSESARKLLAGGHCRLANMSMDSFVTIASPLGSKEPRAFRDVLADYNRDRQLSIDVEVQALDGRRFPAEVRITPVPQNNNDRYIVVIRETTDSLVLRKTSQHSETCFQVLFANLPEGVFRCRADGTLLTANPAMAHLLGFPTADELLKDGAPLGFWQDTDAMRHVFATLAEHGVARGTKLELRRRNGDVVPVLASIRSVTDDNGATLVYEGTLSDISDLTEVHQALGVDASHFRGLTEHSLDITAVVDIDGVISYSSPSRMLLTGADTAATSGQDFFRPVHEDDIDAARQVVADAFASPGAEHRLTCRMHCYDGRVRTFESACNAYMDSKGMIRCLVRTRDISARATTPEVQKREPVTLLSDCVIHDLSDLLTVMNSNLELIDTRTTSPVTRTYLDNAQRACKQFTGLVRNLKAHPVISDVASDAPAAGDKQGRILVVDDRTDVRAATTSLLRSMGYVVIVAPHGQAALHMLQTTPVDLLVSDISMPKVAGDELADMASRQWPDIKVLLMSGNENAIASLESAPDKSYEMIRKPFTRNELAEKVGSIMTS